MMRCSQIETMKTDAGWKRVFAQLTDGLIVFSTSLRSDCWLVVIVRGVPSEEDMHLQEQVV